MTTDICEKIENDEFFQQFLSPSSKPPKQSSIISFSDQINKLSEGLDNLSTELQSQVRNQHGHLLSQSVHAGKLGNSLDSVICHMERLQNGAERLKSQVNTPFNLLENQTKVLEHLHEASHLLRQTGRFLQLYRKLKITKLPFDQAIILYEIEPLIDDTDLSKIEFIKDERSSIVSIRLRLISVATLDLTNGLKNGSEEQVTNGLQILSNLQKLKSSVEGFVETFINDIKQSIKDCFTGNDVTSLNASKQSSKSAGSRGPGKVPTLTTSQNFRVKLWTSLDWLFDEEIYGFCQQIILLQKSLKNVNFINSESTETTDMEIENRFWLNLEELLKKSFRDCPIHISQCLQQQLPKLLAAARGLQSKLDNRFIFQNSTFEALESGYLEKCAINLKSALIGTDCPTQESVDVLVRSASTELSAALVDEGICFLVAGAFSACNKDFWTKIEAHVKLGTDSQQVLDNPNASQIQNTTLANTIYYHNVMVRRMISNLGSNFIETSAGEKILNDLSSGQVLVLAILQQLIGSMNSAVNIILLSMHREPGLNNASSSSGSSLYMKELVDFLQRAWSSHISAFNDKKCIEECGKELAKRCIELFVQNLVSVRPISSSGRNRLKTDCTHLETALKPICSDLPSLGNSFRLLRAISSLIQQTPEELSAQIPDLDSPVRPYIILYILFSYAGVDLTSPHTAAGWGNEKLIQWLEGHTSEIDRLELISGALQKYRNIVRQKNITQYDPVYPQISSYLEKAIKSCKFDK